MNGITMQVVEQGQGKLITRPPFTLLNLEWDLAKHLKIGNILMNSPAKRIYRGVIHDRHLSSRNVCYPVQQPRNSTAGYQLIYRGHTYWFDPRSTIKTNLKPMDYGLIYRGSAYRVSRNELGEVNILQSSASLSIASFRQNVSSSIQKIFNKSRS
jgi:Domain of unknown function (DUF4278)